MAPFTTAALLPLLSVASALSLGNLADARAGPGFVHVPLARQRAGHPALVGRDTANTGATDLYNLQTSYTINLTIAGQQTQVVVDTGSSELWVDPDCSTASRASAGEDGSPTYVDTATTDPKRCEAIGRYDPKKSSTAKSLDQASVFNYGDWTQVTVNYYQDTIDIGGLTIKDQIFGVANASNQTGMGIMGIGPDAYYGFNKTKPYSLILDTMAAQGQINSRAFSLDLRNYDNNTGSLIFGGVDKGRFSGSLQKMPLFTVQMESGDQSYANFAYWTTVESLALAQPGSKDGTKYDLPGGSISAVLDSGTSAILVPDGVTEQICTGVNGTMNSAGSCSVDCAVRNRDGGLDVGFAGKTIRVGYDNLISPLTYDGKTSCSLDVGPRTRQSDPKTYIFGAPFLRAAYAVFDWDNQNVYLAQAADCGSDIVAIGNGTDAVPTDKGNCKEASSGSERGTGVNAGLVLALAVFGVVMAL